MLHGSSGYQFIELLCSRQLLFLEDLSVDDLFALREDINRVCPGCDGAGRQVRIMPIEDGELAGFTALSFRGCPLCFETGHVPWLCKN